MVWRLIAWIVFTLVQRRVALAGDLDRERAASSLREHYAGGYLTLDEFSRRTGRVLSARSRGQVQRALFGLSRPSARRRGAIARWATWFSSSSAVRTSCSVSCSRSSSG